MVLSLFLGHTMGENKTTYIMVTIIFSNYKAGNVLPYKANGEVQHGWQLGNGIPGDILKDNIDRDKNYYLWNEKFENSMLDGFSNASAIVFHLYTYMIKKRIKTLYLPKSLILFPFHTCENENFFDITKTYQKYLQQIEHIRSSFNKISASLYWKEFENDMIVQMFKSYDIFCTLHGL